MYKIGKWYLEIWTETIEEFYLIYDKAMEEIPDNALNKKWRRSFNRNACSVEFGIYHVLVPLNNPTLKKILTT